MAEQGLAENGDQAAAAMAAAAIEADIDSMMEQPVRDGSSAEEAQGDASDGTPPAAADGASTFLVIKELRGISRGRSLRLQPEDIVVAVDGMPYHQDIETFLDIIFECDPETGKLLTIWRNGVLFNVIVRGPLGCTLEHARPEVAEKVTADFAKYTAPQIGTLATYEVLRDMFRKCIVIDTRLSQMAMIFPPLWLAQNRLWEVLIATFLIYGATLSVHWVLFVITYVILSIYFRKAHLVLRRSFAMMRGRHIWIVAAAASELEIQRLCRSLDAKCTFTPDLVGPPQVEEAPRKRRRRRG